MHKYQLKQMIGSGTYSQVFRAVHKTTYQAVAIKVMKKPYSEHKNTQDLQLNSLRKFAYNPCVIQIKQVIVEKGILHIVFELLAMNLIDYYKELKNREGRGMTQEEIKSVVFQMALALRDIHRQGFVHRDIKPQNMLVSLKKEGFLINEVKLVDFGLTKKLSKQKNTNYIATRWYRSPQLLLGMNYDYGVDVFALGCVMIQMYLGYEAFQGRNTIDQMNKEFVVLGTPKESDWPQAYKILNKSGIQLPEYEKINIKENIKGTSTTAANLIDRMIQCNPKNRISIDEVLSHRYFDSIRNKLPQRVRKYIQKKSADETSRNTKLGTATTTNQCSQYQNIQNITSLNAPKNQPMNRPASNFASLNNHLNDANAKRAVSNYKFQQRAVSPYLSQKNIPMNLYVSPQRQIQSKNHIQISPKVQTKLDSQTQRQIDQIASHLFNRSPSKHKLQNNYEKPMMGNNFRSLGQNSKSSSGVVAKNAKVSPDNSVKAIGISLKRQKLRRVGIQVTDKNLRRVQHQSGGCMNFFFRDENELQCQYGRKKQRMI